MIDKKSHTDWFESFQKLSEYEHEKVISKDCFPTEGGLRMGEVIRHVSEITDGQAVVVSDVGQHQMSTARYYKWDAAYSQITSGGLGTMGFCLPAAIGAKLGVGDSREVIAIIGDGGFQMTLQELGTLNQLGISVKIIILNNNFLGMVRQWQDLFFEKRYSYTELTNPDFVTIARGFGIDGKTISEREELVPALKDLISRQGSFLLEVKVEKEDNVFPMVPAGGTVSEMRLE
jgi:acetolactate synthase-1/2/3 large subunit